MRKNKRKWLVVLIVLTALAGLLIGSYVVVQTASAAVQVTQTEAKIQLNRTTLLLGVGESYQLFASVTGDDSVTQWSSMDKAVVSVKDGKVTALSEGQAAVKVRTAGGLLAICRITVKKAPDCATLSANELLLGVGEPYQFFCNLPAGTAAWVRSYASSNSRVVTCTPTGAIAGRKPGKATVTATLYNGVTAQCQVTVGKAPDTAALSADTLELGVGEKYRFSCTVPKGTAARVREYSVSDKTVLDLNGGTIKAKKAGTTAVTVKLYNGVTAQCRVTVKKAPDTATLSVSRLTLGVGESYTFYCRIPDGTAARVRTYSVSDKTILDINGGTIKAKKTGTATVTVKLYNGVTAQCQVTVRKAPDTVMLSAGQLTIGVGESYRMSYSLPADSASYAVRYVVDTPSVVAIHGNIICGRTVGTTTVRLQLYNGVTASCQVTVRKAPDTVSLNYSELQLSVGESSRLSCVLPDNTACYYKTFTSSDTGIVTCDNNGNLKAVSAGTATVTVRLYNNRSASCKVTVAQPPQYISVTDDLAVLDVGHTFRVSPQTENGSSYGSVTYSSGNRNVAAVSADGLVREVGAGTTDITVRTYNGSIAKVTVIVYGDKSTSSYPTADETDQYLNRAALHPMKTNCVPLDNLVDSILNSVTRSGMTTAQKVHAVYDYLAQNSTYGYGYIPVTLPGTYDNYSDYWIVTMAYSLLKNHVGTCENFSAALTVLFRRIGLEANSVEGLVGMRAGGKGGHYWTDVNINGEHRVFDAQVENNNLGYGGTVYHYWYGMKPEYNYRSYEYQALIPAVNFRYH